MEFRIVLNKDKIISSYIFETIPNEVANTIHKTSNPYEHRKEFEKLSKEYEQRLYKLCIDRTNTLTIINDPNTRLRVIQEGGLFDMLEEINILKAINPICIWSSALLEIYRFPSIKPMKWIT